MKEKEIEYLEKLSDIDIKISERNPNEWMQMWVHTEDDFDEYPKDFKSFEKYDAQVRSIFHSEMEAAFSAKYPRYNFQVFRRWGNNFSVKMMRLRKEEIEAARGLKRKREELSGCVIA